MRKELLGWQMNPSHGCTSIINDKSTACCAIVFT